MALGSGYFVGAMIAFFLTYSQKGRVFEWLYKILFASFVFVGLMMLGAIWQRIGQYGITIDRWLVVSWVIAVLGIGCAGLLKATKRFLIISGVLFVLGGVSFFGPFNAENLAFLSQKARLEALLLKYDKYFPLTSGSLVSFPQYSLEDSEEVAQILDYLIDYHGVRRLE